MEVSRVPRAWVSGIGAGHAGRCRSADDHGPATAPQTPPLPGQYEPKVGQPGKDVVWVPSPESTVEKMLDVAKVTSQDFVVDLGSGDGRNVIAAAKRGARALGVEYNPDMVELSKRNAAKAGVGDKATFVQGDMYAAESAGHRAGAVPAARQPAQAAGQVRRRSSPARASWRTRSASRVDRGRNAQITDNCMSWCTVLLYFVPAKVDGTWQTPQGPLTLKQQSQTRERHTRIGQHREWPHTRRASSVFTVAGTPYTARVTGETMTGTTKALRRRDRVARHQGVEINATPGRPPRIV